MKWKKPCRLLRFRTRSTLAATNDDATGASEAHDDARIVSIVTGSRTEVLLGEVKGGEAGLLAALAIVKVVIVEAKHGGGVGDEGVGVGVAALGGRLATEEEVMRRMKVDLPQPESAARPMMTGPSRAAWVTTLRRTARVLVGAASFALEPKDLRAARGAERKRRTWSWWWPF